MEPNLKSIQSITPTANTPNIVTTVEKNRVVAHVYGYEKEVEEHFHTGKLAKLYSKTWDSLKPDIRAKAQEALSTLAKVNAKAKAVLLHSSNGEYIEICPSNKRKEVLKELVDEAKYRGINVIEEQVEVTLTGPLAKWAVSNLHMMTDAKTLEDHSSVKIKHVLVENFIDLFNTVLGTDASIVELFKKLLNAGYNLPAVEVKDGT